MDYKKRRLIVLILIALLIVVLALVSKNFKYIIDNPQLIRDFISGFGIWAPVVAVLLIAFQGIFFLFPVQILITISGILFGFYLSFLYSLIGLVIGALITFLIARRLGRPLGEKWIKKEEINYFDNLFKKYGVYIVFIGRIVLPIPTNVLSFASGLTKMSFKKYFFATFFGFIPAAIIYSLFGEQLTKGIFTMQTITFFVILVILCLVVFKYNRQIYEFLHKFVRKK